MENTQDFDPVCFYLVENQITALDAAAKVCIAAVNWKGAWHLADFLARPVQFIYKATGARAVMLLDGKANAEQIILGNLS